MKGKIIAVMLLALTMTAFSACGQGAEEAMNPQIETVEPTDEVEGDEEETEKVDETEGQESKETETVKEVAEDTQPKDVVVAGEDFLNYINEKRAEAGLETFTWSDELFELTTERLKEYVKTSELPSSDIIGFQMAGAVKYDELDFDSLFEKKKASFLKDYSDYVAGDASVGTYYDGYNWIYVFDAIFNPRYTYTELDETTYYTVGEVNVRRRPTTDSEKITSLSKDVAVKVVAQCNETGWYRIKDSNGGVGYVSDEYLTTKKPEMQVASTNKSKTPSSNSNGSSNVSTGSEEQSGLTFEFEGEGFSTGSSTVVESGDTRMLYEILDLVNNARADAGLGALEWDSSLDSDAIRRAVEISTNFVHENLPSGCGENIAQNNTDSATTLFNNWWHSDGHRANMLGASYSKISVAVYRIGDKCYASMLLR